MDRGYTEGTQRINEFEVGARCISDNDSHELLQEGNAVLSILLWLRARTSVFN
jgi:hypothetical protein